MPIAILVLVIVAYGYVMVAYPEYRTWGLALGAVVAAGLGAYFWFTEPESARTAARIGPDDVVLDQVELERTIRGATLSGRVRNQSQGFRLRELTIALRLHDCPEEDAELADCPVVGDAAAIARPDAPPGQVRSFTAHYTFPNLPPDISFLRWEWSIVETRATQS
jgi:hypothetical protein